MSAAFLETVIAELRAIRAEVTRCTEVLQARDLERLRRQSDVMNETEAERQARLRFGYQKPYGED